MTATYVWSERNDPNAPGGAWRDCTYSAGLMAMVFAGWTKFPLGIYTVAEREALERSDDQPDETGASLDDLIVAVKRRYGVTWAKSSVGLLAQHHSRSDLGFIIQGNNGNLPAGHPLRKWDPGFTGGHAVFIVPTGDGTHVRWHDPEAPNKSSGVLVDWATVTKWIGAMPFFISVRSDAYAPVAETPVPPTPAPVTYTQAQMDAVQAALKDAISSRDLANAALSAARAQIDALNTRIAAAKTALG